MSLEIDSCFVIEGQAEDPVEVGEVAFLVPTPSNDAHFHRLAVVEVYTSHQSHQWKQLFEPLEVALDHQRRVSDSPGWMTRS